MSSFGNKLKLIREERNLSQEEMANILATSKQVLSRYETGQRVPKISTVSDYARTLGVTVQSLVDDSMDIEYTNSEFKLTQVNRNTIRPEFKKPEVTYAVATWKREYQEHADEYAKLDDYGREAVDAVTKVELARVKYEQEELERVDYNNIITISKSDFAASAGTGIYLGPESFSQIKVCKNNLTKKAKFAVPVRGNSMNPDFFNGQILLVGEEQPKMGEFGIFTLDGEGYVKMLGDGILIPMNTKYPNIKMNDSIRCNGKVLGVLNPDWIVEEN